jgi:hypothetical protein
MIKKRVIFLLFALCLVFPAVTYAQRSKSADRSWNSFWAQFVSAINRKNKASVKRLMASERDFSSKGMENRDEWLALVDKQRWWGDFQRSVRGGTKPYDYDGKPGRVTRDELLIFAYIGGRWRFMGPMGD